MIEVLANEVCSKRGFCPDHHSNSHFRIPRNPIHHQDVRGGRDQSTSGDINKHPTEPRINNSKCNWYHLLKTYIMSRDKAPSDVNMGDLIPQCKENTTRHLRTAYRTDPGHSSNDGFEQ